MNPDFQLIQPEELQAPNLSKPHFAALLTAVNVVGAGLGTVTVAVRYPENVAGSEPRQPGRDFVEIPGIPHDVHVGKLHVARRVDNAKNRREGVVGKPKLMISSFMRGDGVNASFPTGVCVEGLTSFVVTGFRPNVPLPEQAQAPEEGA